MFVFDAIKSHVDNISGKVCSLKTFLNARKNARKGMVANPSLYIQVVERENDFAAINPLIYC
jgi:hypothetical protein